MPDKVIIFFVQDVRIWEGKEKVKVFHAGEYHSLTRDVYETIRKECPRHVVNLTRKLVLVR